MNHSELSRLPIDLPELSMIRQQQLDWCISRISMLELSYDCLANRVLVLDNVNDDEPFAKRFETPICGFEFQLFGVPNDVVKLWSEYWETIFQSVIKSVSDSIDHSSHAVAGASGLTDTAKPLLHNFLLTGTPMEKSVGLQLTCIPSLGFKPVMRSESLVTDFKIKVYLDVGQTSVTNDVFDRMQLGGLLVLRNRATDGLLSGLRVLTVAQSFVCLASWNLDEGTILVTDKQMSASHNQDEIATETSDSGITIPVYAQIELQAVNLDQLKTLREDDTLETGVMPKDVIVKLSAGGVAFGEGLLVQIEGRLAVRITKLNRRGI